MVVCARESRGFRAARWCLLLAPTPTQVVSTDQVLREQTSKLHAKGRSDLISFSLIELVPTAVSFPWAAGGQWGQRGWSLCKAHASVWASGVLWSASGRSSTRRTPEPARSPFTLQKQPFPRARPCLGCGCCPSRPSWARHWTLVSTPRARRQSLTRPLGQAEGLRVPPSRWEAAGTGARLVCVCVYRLLC